ncbi:acyl-CoA dehydrogenase family protein [Streptomyces sp. NPDC018610]|uniref:acyl-CoA dehydrogenase family protein n=1 Tax=Streptomyces sp. NPDC018610 TaxID=3365049 RepID=UPI00379768A6
MSDRQPGPPDGDAAGILAELAASGTLTELYGKEPTGRLDPLLLRRILREADARGPQGTVLALLVQLATATPLLADAADSPATTEILRGALDGTRLLALAATDAASAGSDLAALGTTVDLPDSGNDGDLVLDGGKRWVTSALTAGHALVLARHRPGRHFTSFTWVLVPLTAPGVTVRPADTELFLGAGLGHLDFRSVRLPRAYVLGRPGRGLAHFARHMAVERLASAAWAVELCRRVVADTAHRLTTRTVDGTPLRQSPSVRQRLAGCAVRVSALDALWNQSADPVATRYDATAAATLKALSGMTVEHVLTECGHLQGADGFARDGVQRLRAEAAVFGIGGGTTELVLDTVAERLDQVLGGRTR